MTGIICHLPHGMIAEQPSLISVLRKNHDIFYVMVSMTYYLS